MYENTGKKILSLARVLTILMMVLVILTGIIMGVSTRNGALGLGVAILVIGIGCLFAWLSNLLLAGFGELVSNSYELLQFVKNGGAGFAQKPPPPNHSSRTPVPPQQQPINSANPGEWVCAGCNAINQNKNSNCWDCGALKGRRTHSINNSQ